MLQETIEFPVDRIINLTRRTGVNDLALICPIEIISRNEICRMLVHLDTLHSLMNDVRSRSDNPEDAAERTRVPLLYSLHIRNLLLSMGGYHALKEIEAGRGDVDNFFELTGAPKNLHDEEAPEFRFPRIIGHIPFRSIIPAGSRIEAMEGGAMQFLLDGRIYILPNGDWVRGLI